MDYTIEAKLIHGIKNRDNAAFEHLHLKCYKFILTMVRKASGSDEDAEDLYNDGIAILIQKLDRPDFKLKSSVSALLFTICIRRYITSLKRKKHKEDFLDEYNGDSFEENFEEKMDRTLFKDILWTCFEKLKKDCQHILDSYMNGIPLKKIAEEIDLSPNYMKKKRRECHRAWINFVNKHPEYAMMVQNNEIEINQ